MGWTRIFRRRAWDDVRARELESYLELETAENLARGMPPEEARNAARRKLGNSTLVREEIYRMNSLGFLETFWQDLRYGIRVLRKAPMTTAVALLSLALGTGATSAIFSAVYGVIISPYPYARPYEIWAPGIHTANNPDQWRAATYSSEYLELQKLPSVARTMATSPGDRILTGEHAPENLQAISVTGNAFQFLGVEPILGRTIQPSDIRPDGTPEPVIVLSYQAWQRLFNGGADALGKTLVLNDVPHTVIGVMPSRFGWWTGNGVWLPLAIDPRADRQIFAIVRLRPGASATVAEQQFQAVLGEMAKAHPAYYPKAGVKAIFHNYMDITVASGEMQSSLELLFGAVGFLLLIACANVANLQMARATARAREIALRMSVGAGRARVFRQLLTESGVLAIAGSALGVALAYGLTKAIRLLMPDFYVPNESRIEVNGWVLLFSLGVSVATGILFGLVPGLQCSRLDLVDTLKDAAKGSGVRAGSARLRNLLVVVEVALSVILLVGASLTIRGFVNLEQTQVGFQPERVLMVGLGLPAKRYTTYEQRVAFTQSVLERVSSLPGVQAASIGNGSLPFGGPTSPYAIEGHPRTESQPIFVGLIGAEYPRTLGIPLLAGRALTAQEVAQAEPVALINQAAAKLWPAGESPIGGRIRLDILTKAPNGAFLAPRYTQPGAAPFVTVAGIIGDTRNQGLQKPAAPSVYVPYTVIAPTGRTLALRTLGAPTLLLNAVREQVRQIDKDQPVSRPITLEEVMGFETVQPRFNMALFGFFGGLGLALAAVGIFSVLNYIVVRRTHEIGVRMALGAESRNVLSLMFSIGARLVLTGLAVGLAGSFLLARYLRSEIFSVPVTDPVSIAGVVLLLSIAAILACWLPARRAAKLDPMVALRHE